MDTVFVGLAEPDRETCVATLLGNDIPVRLAGRGWQRFLQRWKKSSNLQFEGEDAFGDDYARLLSESWVGLGLLSKRFPELHTTRTFEIPACGAVLATERNRETEQFFNPDEALFFSGYENLAEKLSKLFAQGTGTLEAMANAGRKRVARDARDYSSILLHILADPRITL
jgi:spore maturation protein CgeB